MFLVTSSQSVLVCIEHHGSLPAHKEDTFSCTDPSRQVTKTCTGTRTVVLCPRSYHYAKCRSMSSLFDASILCKRRMACKFAFDGAACKIPCGFVAKRSGAPDPMHTCALSQMWGACVNVSVNMWLQVGIFFNRQTHVYLMHHMIRMAPTAQSILNSNRRCNAICKPKLQTTCSE